MGVLVGFSTKPEGIAALGAAAAEARIRATEVIVVPNTAEDDLGPHEAVLADAGVRWETRPPADSPELIADNLLQAAEAAAAELIVIGLRRRSPTGKLLLGMNAQRVLLDAGAPVLAVKAD